MDAAIIVKRIRALSGITGKELAQLADLAPSTISRIERGILDPTWSTLSRILESTGYRISGGSIVSAGDPTAITAARPLLDQVVASVNDGLTAAADATLAPLRESVSQTTQELSSVANNTSGTVAQALKPMFASFEQTAAPISEWFSRWARAGWITPRSSQNDIVTLAVSAGNAAKLSRRAVPRHDVSIGTGWQTLARRLENAGIDYAVSGLVATRPDRTTAVSANPVFYVRGPREAATLLELDETRPGQGILLIAPTATELEGTETDDGIRFVSRTQAVLDALAGPGREPDKGEDVLRGMLTAQT